MSLVEHARKELELISEDPDTIEGIVKVVEAFAAMGHSGMSAEICIPMVNDLLQFKNLSPITDNPKEWMEVDDELWQSRRNPEIFSDNGGRSYWILSEAKANDSDEHVTYFSQRMHT